LIVRFGATRQIQDQTLNVITFLCARIPSWF